MINMVGLRVESIDGSRGTITEVHGDMVTVAWDSAPDYPLVRDTARYPLILPTNQEPRP
jgi:hypothetical protein